MDATHEQRSQPNRVSRPDNGLPEVTASVGKSMAAGNEIAHATPAQTSEWQVGDRVMGVNELRQIHWGGGMGLVYRACHHDGKVTMAIHRSKNSTPHNFNARSNRHNSC